MAPGNIFVFFFIPSIHFQTTIIAQFNSRKIKNELMREVKKRRLTIRDLGYHRNRPTFWDDHLTTTTKEILKRAEQLKAEGLLKFVWIHDSTVFVRETRDVMAMADSKEG